MAWLSRIDITEDEYLHADQLNGLGLDIRNWGGDVNGGGHRLSNVVLDGSGGFQYVPSPVTITEGADGQSVTSYTEPGSPSPTPPLLRWTEGKDSTPETGGNAGSNFAIRRYADNGVTLLGTPIAINRATGVITMGAQAWAGPINGGGQTLSNVVLAAGVGVPAHTHDAADVVSGILATGRLGAGAASSSVFLRGDGQWAVVPLPAHTHDAADIVSGVLAVGRIPAHTHSGADITTGTVAPARLGSGTPSSSVWLRGDGAWTTLPTLGGHAIQDEGTPLTARANLNFVGAGVAATDDAANNATIISITGGGAGSQTPWTSDINANTFKLYNAGNIGIGVPLAQMPISTAVAGRSYLTIKGASDSGVLELAGGAADADGVQIGHIAFTDPVNSQTDKRMGAINCARQGVTANNRGSLLQFLTRSDNGTAWAERMRIDNAGNVGIGTATPTSRLTASANTAALPSPAAGTVIHAGGADGAFSRIVIDSFGGFFPILNMRAAGGTAAAPTAIPAGGSLGLLAGSGRAATGYASAYTGVQFYAAETLTDTAQGMYMVFRTTPIGSTTAAERVRIDDQGRVGIGTTGPLDPVTVSRNGDSSVMVESTATGSNAAYVKYKRSTTGTPREYWVGAGLNASDEWSIYDKTASAFRLTVLANGNCGIGTSAPTQTLSIDGALPIIELRSGGYFLIRNTANTWDMRLQTVGSGRLDVLSGGSIGTPIASFVHGGNVGIGTTSPSSVLHVRRDAGSTVGPALSLDNSGGGAGSGSCIDLIASTMGQPICARIQGQDNNDYSHNILFHTRVPGNPANGIAERMRITSGGSVGIGTANPTATEAANSKLAIVGAAGQRASSLATSNTQAVVSFRPDVNSGYSTAFGMESVNGWQYIQAVNYNGGAASAGLLLNPWGGSVGIAKTNPGYALDVTGDINCTGAHRVNGVAIGGGGVTTQNSLSSGSRAFGTVYQNTTGKPMAVTIVVNAAASQGIVVYADSASSPATIVSEYISGATSVAGAASFWVLPNHYYKATAVGSPTFVSWTEWT